MPSVDEPQLLWVTGWAIPGLLTRKYHRLLTLSFINHDNSKSFYLFLGMKKENN